MATRILHGFQIFEQFSVSITQGSILWNLVKIGLEVQEMLFKEIVARWMTTATMDGEWSQ